MTRNEINPRCPIHDTMLNAAGDCLLCDHPELDPDGLTAEQAQKELDAIPDRPLTPEELAEIDEVVARVTGALVTPRGLPCGAGEVRGNEDATESQERISKMNRREFLLAGAGVAVALLATDAVSAPDAPRMKHLYSNYDGELVAANTLEDAARHHDCELGGADDPAWDEWYQVADAARIPVHHEDENETETKTAAEWAAEFAEPCVAATTYW